MWDGDEWLWPGNVNPRDSSAQQVIVGQARSGRLVGGACVAVGVGLLLGAVVMVLEAKRLSALALVAASASLVLVGLLPLTRSTWLTERGVCYRRWIVRAGVIPWDDVRSIGVRAQMFPTRTDTDKSHLVFHRRNGDMTVPPVWFGGVDKATAVEITRHLALWARLHGRPPFAGPPSSADGVFAAFGRIELDPSPGYVGSGQLRPTVLSRFGAGLPLITRMYSLEGRLFAPGNTYARVRLEFPVKVDPDVVRVGATFELMHGGGRGVIDEVEGYAQ